MNKSFVVVAVLGVALLGAALYFWQRPGTDARSRTEPSAEPVPQSDSPASKPPPREEKRPIPPESESATIDPWTLSKRTWAVNFDRSMKGLAETLGTPIESIRPRLAAEEDAWIEKVHGREWSWIASPEYSAWVREMTLATDVEVIPLLKSDGVDRYRSWRSDYIQKRYFWTGKPD